MNKKLFLIISVVTLILTFFSFAFIKNEQVEKDLEIFSAFYRTLNEHYVDSIHSDKLIKRVIDATVKLLDPFTVFYDAEQTKEREKAWLGIQYAGIGATIQQFDSLVYITELLDAYPAQKAGLKIGDAFIKINDTLVTGMDVATVRSKLIGPKDTPVKVEIKRNKNIYSYSLIREEVVSPAIDIAYVDDNGKGYIRLNHFLKNSSKLFKQEFLKLKQKNLQHLIIDLRWNSGGIVEETVAILSNFLPAKTEVCFLKGFHKDANYSYYTENTDGDTLLPITLLISNQTISAGEIFAGALQDLDRAKIIGERSYGKGLVQGTRFPGYGTSLYVTAARYFTPSGRCIQEIKYAGDITSTTYNDTLKTFYTKKGKLVKSGVGIEPDLHYKQESKLNCKQIFSEKELFYYMNNIYEDFCKSKDTALFFETETQKLIKYIGLNLHLLKHDADYELARFEGKMKEIFNNDLYTKEIVTLKRKINLEKLALLKISKKEIETELQAQMIKRKYGKLQEEMFRIKNDAIFTLIK